MRLDRVVIYWLKKNVFPTEGKWETKLQLYLHYITLSLVLSTVPLVLIKLFVMGKCSLAFIFPLFPLTLAWGFCVWEICSPPSLISVITVKIILVSALRVVFSGDSVVKKSPGITVKIILVSALRVVFSGGSVVKKSPGMKETQVQSRGWEDPEDQTGNLSSILVWEILWTEVHRVSKQSDVT